MGELMSDGMSKWEYPQVEINNETAAALSLLVDFNPKGTVNESL